MTLERERRGKVEILRLNRPEARNAINPDTSLEIEAALDDIEAEPDVWCVIITGAGPVFCAGADLKVVASGHGVDIMTERGGFAGFVQRELTKPVIAAINGLALAGGFEITLACDLVVAAEDAKFGLPEVQRGLLASAGGPIRLAQRVPLAVALELTVLGEPITAARAPRARAREPGGARGPGARRRARDGRPHHRQQPDRGARRRAPSCAAAADATDCRGVGPQPPDHA